MSINKETVLKIHEQQLLHGEDNADNTVNIVSILGGIDSILRQYLTEPNIVLSTKQLHHIEQTLTIPKEYQQQNKPKAFTVVTDGTHNNNSLPLESTHKHLYTFDVNNTFLRSLCGETTAKRVKQLTRSLYMQIAVILNLVIYLALDFIFPGVIAASYGIAATCCFFIPYGICWILSSNRKAFYLILKSFEFWYKTVYSLIFGVLSVIYLWRLNANREALSSKLYFVSNALIRIFDMPILTVAVASFDAVKASKKWKCVYAIGMALLYTWDSVLYQFLEPNDIDYVIYIQSTGHSVSFQSMLASASRGLAIFFWKQAIFAVLRTEKALTIQDTPVIHWNETASKLDKNETVVKNEVDLSTMNTTPRMEKDASILNQNEDDNSSSSGSSSGE
eukprot:542568_1